VILIEVFDLHEGCSYASAQTLGEEAGEERLLCGGEGSLLAWSIDERILENAIFAEKWNLAMVRRKKKREAPVEELYPMEGRRVGKGPARMNKLEFRTGFRDAEKKEEITWEGEKERDGSLSPLVVSGLYARRPA